MESFFESSFGLKFWRRNKERQKKIEHKIIKRNLIHSSNCLASYRNSPEFAGARDLRKDDVVINWE